MKEDLKIHLGIQVVPLAGRNEGFPAIDRVIDLIAGKGYRYQVTPFETIIECSFEEAIDLIKESAELMNRNFCREYLINSRFHIYPGASVLWEEKVKNIHG